MTFTTIRGTGGAADTFAGSNGVDTIAFVNQNNSFLLTGAQDNDAVTVVTARGFSLTGSLNGGAGNDVYSVTGTTFSNGSLQGNQGVDTLSTWNIVGSTVQAGQGDDFVNIARFSGATVSSSSINGNKGVDTITVGAGAGAGGAATAIQASTIRGGQGIDVINLTGSYVNSQVNGDLDGDIITSNASAAYVSSTIFGGNGDDTITENNAFAAYLSGDDGNDAVNGGGAADTLLGGAGNDTIIGAAGGDTINVGVGTDVARYTGAGESFTGDVVDATTTLSSVDVISGLAVGDAIRTLGTAATTFTVGATAALNAANLNAAAAGGVNTGGIIRGTFNSTTNVFTSGIASTDIDYLVQFGTGAAQTSIVLNDVGIVSQMASSATAVSTYTLS